MKILVLAFIALYSNFVETPLSSVDFQSPPTYVKVEVDGLTCPFCVYGLEKRLKEIEGIKELHIDLENGWTTFALPKKEDDTEEKITKLVEKAGFSAKKVEFSNTAFTQ